MCDRFGTNACDSQDLRKNIPVVVHSKHLRGLEDAYAPGLNGVLEDTKTEAASLFQDLQSAFQDSMSRHVATEHA